MAAKHIMTTCKDKSNGDIDAAVGKPTSRDSQKLLAMESLHNVLNDNDKQFTEETFCKVPKRSTAS